MRPVEAMSCPLSSGLRPLPFLLSVLQVKASRWTNLKRCKPVCILYFSFPNLKKEALSND